MAAELNPIDAVCRARLEHKGEKKRFMHSELDDATPKRPSMYGVHAAASRGFGQIFGIHPAMAFLTLVVDVMLFGGEVGTLGASLPFSCAAGGILAVIAFRAQKKWYGDDSESAFIKALILGFLTAIPTPLPAMLYVPSGVVGFVHNRRGK
jgi:hypothetical protein